MKKWKYLYLKLHFGLPGEQDTYLVVVLCTNLRRCRSSKFLIIALDETSSLHSLDKSSDDCWLVAWVFKTIDDEMKDKGDIDEMRDVGWDDTCLDVGGRVCLSSNSRWCLHALKLSCFLGFKICSFSFWWDCCWIRLACLWWLWNEDEGFKVGRLDVVGERRLANITPLAPPPPHVLQKWYWDTVVKNCKYILILRCWLFNLIKYSIDLPVQNCTDHRVNMTLSNPFRSCMTNVPLRLNVVSVWKKWESNVFNRCLNSSTMIGRAMLSNFHYWFNSFNS